MIERLPKEILYDLVISADEKSDFWRAGPKVPARNFVGRRQLKPVSRIVSQLSHHWRDLVNGWPRCFAMDVHISSHSKLSDKEIASLMEVLQCSQQCDIDIWVYVTQKIVEDVYDLIIPYAAQIRSIYQYLSLEAEGNPSVLRLLASVPDSSRLAHLGLGLVGQGRHSFNMPPRKWDKSLRLYNFDHRWSLSSLRADGLPPGELCKLGLTKATCLKLAMYSSYHDMATLFQSTDLTDKLWLQPLLGLPEDLACPEPGENGDCLALLRILRIDDYLPFICWLLMTANTSSLTKLHLRVPPGTGFHSPAWMRPPNLTHLTDLTVAITGSAEYLQELLNILPMSLVKNLTLEVSRLTDLTVYSWPRVAAPQVTRLACKASSLQNAVLTFNALYLPSLTDLRLHFSSRNQKLRYYPNRVLLSAAFAGYAARERDFQLH